MSAIASLNAREGEPRDPAGYAVENFGLVDNLMIARAIADAGGSIAAVAERSGDALAAFDAFAHVPANDQGTDRAFASERETISQGGIAMPAGAFQIRPRNENFDLKPKGAGTKVPEDQRKISHDVYETRSVLVFLNHQGVFADDKGSFKEYITRTIRAANVGSIARNANLRLVAEAL